jgi:hypothetical protein
MLAWAAAARGRRDTATGVPERAASKAAAVAAATVPPLLRRSPPLARAEDARCRGLDTRASRVAGARQRSCVRRSRAGRRLLARV